MYVLYVCVCTYCTYVCVCTVHALKKLTFYGRTTPTATGVRRLRLQAYDAYGYGRTTLTATGVLGLRLWAYYAYGTGVLRYNCGHATGVLWACGRV